ncbi:hypothetical protein [Skermanella pratensis]|uniref:hypothetical protein n=1 Tax=Skermanella pratensis TaxID=2233999 RepID=UPI0013010434|nr:hypothetical protein [Skermanella pratensis]
MLNVYPISATVENWVHDAIYAKVKAGLKAFDQGNTAPDWSHEMRVELADREALKTAYNAFCTAVQELGPRQRGKILLALEAQNKIPDVFDGATACPRLDTLPARIRKPTKALFDAAFAMLKSLKVRDRQYEVIFAELPGRCCPFCGIEIFEAPGLAREDLDHYLPRTLYPFAGANLRNLAPMGGKCNRAYKNVADVICDGDGHRRRCFDPYGQERAEVSLMGSRPFEGGGAGPFPLPAWQIDFIGEAQAVATWDQVFDIRRRYEGKVSSHFREWMEHFADWCQREVGLIETQQEVVKALDRYITAVLQRTHGNGEHLKRAMFEMMRQRCEGGDISERLVLWFSNLVRSQRRMVEEPA